MRKDNSELNREFLGSRLWRSLLKIVLLVGLLTVIYGVVLSMLAMRSSY